MTGYIFTHEGRQFSPDGAVQLEDVDAHNRALDASTLEYWAECPPVMPAYVGDGKVTTWLGVTLGTIVRSSTYRSNLGGRMRAITVKGTNGATYHGRYGSDWSQLVRLRKAVSA